MADLIINDQGLVNAASSYGNARNRYDALLDELNGIFGLVTSEWSDQVGQQFGEEAKKVIAELSKVSTNLNNNASFLCSVAKTTVEHQQRAQATVNNIM